MGRDAFTDRLGDMQNKAAYIVKNAGALKALAKLDPTAVPVAVAGIAASDAAQEALKVDRSGATEAKTAAVNEAMIAASGTIHELIGAIKKAKLPTLLSKLPKIGKADSHDAKVGLLTALIAFIAKNPKVSGKITKSEIAELTAGLAGSVSAQSVSREAKTALPESTEALEADLQETSLKVTAWLNLYASIYELTKDKKALKILRALRAKGEKAATVVVPGTPVGGS